jgi:CheY-like chemotaxis protein
VSSYAMAGHRKKAMDLGFVGYLEKPISPDTFAAEIAQFLPPPAYSHEDSERR